MEEKKEKYKAFFIGAGFGVGIQKIFIALWNYLKLLFTV